MPGEVEAHLAAVFEKTPGHFSVEPTRFGIVTFNEAFARQIRESYGSEVRRGMTPEELLPPEAASQWRRLLLRAIRTGCFRTEQVTADNKILLLALNRLDRGGRTLGVSMLVVDVTEAHNAQHALAQVRTRVRTPFQALVDTAPGTRTLVAERGALESQLRQAVTELHRLKDRLRRDTLALRQLVTPPPFKNEILGQSLGIRNVIEQAKAVAPTDSVVLITGETGTGKELLARAIHQMSPRADMPIVTVNCAALPAGLIESELFGREKGAFTGASSRQKGRFEAADGGTLFLDEVAELSLEVQAKLLRVLQDGQFERLGSGQPVRVNVRVIAATNHDLGAMVESNRFRADLFYRLHVFPIEIPPLRARRQDIPLLVWDAVRFFSAKLGKTIDSIPVETMRQLQQHPWPGNVRELRNVIERSVILSGEGALSVALDLADERETEPITLADAQRRHVVATLERTGWRVGGKDGAAVLLGVRRSTLNSIMKRLGISRPVS